MNDIMIAFCFLCMVIAPCVAARMVCVSQKRAAALAGLAQSDYMP